MSKAGIGIKEQTLVSQRFLYRYAGKSAEFKETHKQFHQCTTQSIKHNGDFVSQVPAGRPCQLTLQKIQLTDSDIFYSTSIDDGNAAKLLFMSSQAMNFPS